MKREDPEKLKAYYQRGNRRGTELKRERRRAAASRPMPAVCESCRQPPKKGDTLMFDHCHARGVFRGWLCRLCNLAAGYLKDSPERCLLLASYLSGSTRTT